MFKKECCYKEYNLDERFCEVCGKPLVCKKYCDNCEKEAGIEEMYCGNCGYKLEIQEVQLINSVQPKSKNIKNKIIGIIAVLIVLVLLFSIIIVKINSKPIIGKWAMELMDNTNTFTTGAYIEFKSNGTYEEHLFDMVSDKGTYKIIRNGIKGKILLLPNDIKQKSIETDYSINSNIIEFSNKSLGLGKLKKIK